MNETNNNQLKLTEKFRELFDCELDWSTRRVTRGRGRSIAYGSCGWSVYERLDNGLLGRCFMFYGGIRKYLPKKYFFSLNEESYGDYGVYLRWFDKNGLLRKE